MRTTGYILLFLFLFIFPDVQARQSLAYPQQCSDTLNMAYVFQLYGQTRRYAMRIYKTDEGGARIDWTIFSYQKWLKGSYLISPEGLCCGTELNFKQPQNGNEEHLKANETFGLISVSAFDRLKQEGVFVYSNTTYRLKEKQRTTVGDKTVELFYVVADVDHTEMWIWDNRELPVIFRIEKNPLEINFYVERFRFGKGND